MTPEANNLPDPIHSPSLRDGKGPTATSSLYLQELELARKVCLELIRDCPEATQSYIKDSFNKALKTLN